MQEDNTEWKIAKEHEKTRKTMNTEISTDTEINEEKQEQQKDKKPEIYT